MQAKVPNLVLRRVHSDSFLLEANMKDVYERAELGWSERNMREEMFEDNAW